MVYNILMTEQTPEGVSWLSRLKGLLKLGRARRERGDVISANIGSQARGVAVGKNIVQIGTLVVPTGALLLVFLPLLLALAFFGYRQIGPSRMSGNFNIAIAEFGRLDNTGRVHRSEAGRVASLWLFEGMKVEFENLPTNVLRDFRPQLWHDSLGFSQKRVRIGVVDGETLEERQHAACLVAERINAHAMIYGNLPPVGSSENFVPEFVVCQNAAFHFDAAEIVGNHSLGTGISTALIERIGDPVEDIAVTRRLNEWGNSLALFSIGVMYDLIGSPEFALNVFEQALERLATPTSAGSEVLWFFIGRERLWLAREANDGQLALILQAQEAFERALCIHLGYARARIGLGGVYLVKAQLLPADERLATPDPQPSILDCYPRSIEEPAPALELAIAEYEFAVAESPGSPGALVEIKAQLALGTAYYLKGETLGILGDFSGAGEALETAIALITPALSVLEQANQYRVLGQAYLALGNSYFQKGHLLVIQGGRDASIPLFEQAREAYLLCTSQKEAAPADLYLEARLSAELCEPYKQAVEKTLADIKGTN